MPTLGERLIRSHALGRLNGLKKLRAKKMKKQAAGDRTPMLNQVGTVLERSGYEHEKPADIIKRVIAKGKVLPDQKEKLSLSSPGPTSSHHAGPRRRSESLDIPRDSTGVKLSGVIGRAAMGSLGKVIARKPVGVAAVKSSPRITTTAQSKWIGAGGGEYTPTDVSRALGGNPAKGWERLGEQEAREMLKTAIAGAVAGAGARLFGGLARGIGRMAGPKARIGVERAGKAISRRPILTGVTAGSFAPSSSPKATMMPTLPMGGR